MSHTARVRVEFRDLKQLARAAARVGLELVENQTTFWFDRECLHAIRPASDAQRAEYRRMNIETDVEFPLGVRRSESGNGFDLVFDDMQGRWCHAAANQLKQSYAAVAAIAAARKQGFRIREQHLATGEIRLLLSK